MKTNSWLVAAIIFLGISIIFSGIFIGSSLKAENQVNETEINEVYLLDLEGASKYLGLSTDDINAIILYSDTLYDHGIPYFKIGLNKYFSKEALEQWILKISEIHAEF